METLLADARNSQIDREFVAGAHHTDKVDVVFEIHSPRFPRSVVRIGETDCRIECVTRVVEHDHKVPDVHMPVAVGPFGARDSLVTGRPQFPNLV